MDMENVTGTYKSVLIPLWISVVLSKLDPWMRMLIKPYWPIQCYPHYCNRPILVSTWQCSSIRYTPKPHGLRNTGWKKSTDRHSLNSCGMSCSDGFEQRQKDIELFTMLTEKWNPNSADTYFKLVERALWRVEAVVAAKGGLTSYWHITPDPGLACLCLTPIKCINKHTF